jgi:hypothetical protein
MDLEQGLPTPNSVADSVFSFIELPTCDPPMTPPSSDSGDHPTAPPSSGSSSSSSSTQATMSTAVATVTAPKLGGTVDKNVVWIGGPPKAAFDGPYLKRYATPLCFRGLDSGSKIKSYAKHIEGLETKFKCDDPDFGLLALADVSL